MTGPRRLEFAEAKQLEKQLLELLRDADWLYVGDADGVDRAARLMVACNATSHSPNPWQTQTRVFGVDDVMNHLVPMAARLQDRSKRMVEALRDAGGTLHGWPNKPCPPGLTRSRWHGQGTWGTLYYAWTCGVPIVLHPLAEIELPHWCQVQQQTLL